MKALEIIQNEEFFKRKQNMIDFLQQISYDRFKSRVEQEFSNPGENLKQLKTEIGNLEERIKEYKRQDTTPLPFIDKKIEQSIRTFAEITEEFNKRIRENYEDKINKFSRKFK